MAEKVVEKTGALERKAIIKNADMTEDMQQDAIECASQVRAFLLSFFLRFFFIVSGSFRPPVLSFFLSFFFFFFFFFFFLYSSTFYLFIWFLFFTLPNVFVWSPPFFFYFFVLSSDLNIFRAWKLAYIPCLDHSLKHFSGCCTLYKWWSMRIIWSLISWTRVNS